MGTQLPIVLAMAAFAFLTGALFLAFAISARRPSEPTPTAPNGGDISDQTRIQLADDDRERISPLPRYMVSAVGFATAVALLVHLVSPAVAYALICLALAGRCVADQIAEERAPRRRSALIGQRRGVDLVLLTWIALAGVSSLLLIPSLLDETYRVAAIFVTFCALAMLGVAWRVATASPLLFGNDLEAEQVVDRETRAIRTGNACFLTVAAVVTFVALVRGGIEVPALLVVCFGLWAWRSIYARRLARTPLAS